jgi:hypothetical protein
MHDVGNMNCRTEEEEEKNRLNKTRQRLSLNLISPPSHSQVGPFWMLPELFRVFAPSFVHHQFLWQLGVWNVDPLPFVADPAVKRGPGGFYVTTREGLPHYLALGDRIHQVRLDPDRPDEWVRLDATRFRAKRVFVEARTRCSLFVEATYTELMPSMTMWQNKHLVHWALATGRIDFLDVALARSLDPTLLFNMVISNRWLRTVLHATLVSVAAYHGQVASLDWLWQHRANLLLLLGTGLFTNAWVLWSVLTDVSTDDTSLNWMLELREDEETTRFEQCIGVWTHRPIVALEVGAILTRVIEKNHCVAMRRAWCIPQLRPCEKPRCDASDKEDNDDDDNDDDGDEDGLWLQRRRQPKAADWCCLARACTDASVDVMAIAVSEHHAHTHTLDMWKVLVRNCFRTKLSVAALLRLQGALSPALLDASHADWHTCASQRNAPELLSRFASASQATPRIES